MPAEGSPLAVYELDDLPKEELLFLNGGMVLIIVVYFVVPL